MGLEAASYVDDLVTTNPVGASDTKAQGDDHLRLIKTVLKATFPGMAGRFNRIQEKSGNYTAVLNDATSLLVFTAAATLTLTAAATLGNGWTAHVYNPGGDVTVDPNSSETVNEETTQVIPRGCAATIFCDGDEFYMFVHAASGVGWAPGDVKATAKAAADAGWLLCYGQAVSRTTYAALYAAIGTTYGVGDGSTTFNVPDLRGRVIAGQDDMGGSSANRLTGVTGSVDGDTLGGTGGAETHTLTTAELAAHAHTQQGTFTSGPESANHTHGGFAARQDGGSADYSTGGGGSAGSSQVTNTGGVSANHAHDTTISGSTTSAGSDSAHNNVQPTIILNYVIKY